jgi:5-oxoprolinase (ATP-hydrolysing) subunit A
MKTIDINCDMGESFGRYSLGMDAEVIPYISSANIACGFHAGDPVVLDRTVRMAVEHGVGVGAHPGFPDLLGFGRRNMDCTPEEIRTYLIYQIGALQAFCTVHGTRLRHVKPHGSLYNMAARNRELARTIAEAVAGVDPRLLLVVLAGRDNGEMRKMAGEAGVKVVFEAFPDRAYTVEGALVSRLKPHALVKDPHEAAERALRMAEEGVVIAEDGSSVPLEVDTLCVHGDTPGAVDLVRTIRGLLEVRGVTILPMGETVGKGEL